MKTVAKIIELLRKDLAGLRENYIKLEATGFMPLVVEWCGHGPNELPVVSVAHYFEQAGDLMADPELTFEVSPHGTWAPLSYTQHNLGLYQVAVWVDENGVVRVDPKLLRELKSFMRLWDRNLAEQGFVAEAERIAKQ